MLELFTGCLDVWTDCIFDIIKTLPILLVVYLIIGWLEARMDTVTRIVTSTAPAGPVIGALVGSIPQCGFSVGCSALYCRGFLAPATLVAVYLATSDEAIPVLLAGDGDWRVVLTLIVVKIIIAVVFGYLFYFTVFRNKWNPDELEDDEMEMDEVSCSCCGAGNTLLGSALRRTVSTTVYLLVTMLILNTIVYLIGEDTLTVLLLGGTIFQPILCALIGLFPGCAVSVLLTELLAKGAISFGSAVAGLSAGAGLGFILLVRESPRRRDAAIIIVCTYLAAVVSGLMIDLIL